MKFNFKKISAIATSVLMTGLTVGTAAAANFPAPFVEGGVADVALVYGTSAPSGLDAAQAGNIYEALEDEISGKTTVTGGEAKAMEKSSDNFNIEDALNSVELTLDKEDLDY